jgi:hypothetical protein
MLATGNISLGCAQRAIARLLMFAVYVRHHASLLLRMTRVAQSFAHVVVMAYACPLWLTVTSVASGTSSSAGPGFLKKM